MESVMIPSQTTVGAASRGDYVQDERYIASVHMDKERPGTGREGSLGCVRRDCASFAHGQINRRETRLPQFQHPQFQDLQFQHLQSICGQRVLE